MTDLDASRNKNFDEAFPPELPRMRRHTLCGEVEVEQQVRQDLSRLAADAELGLAGRLRSLLLIGRFARGEGSVIEHDSEVIAYSGYHCLALANRLSDNDLRALKEMDRVWSEQFKVQVRLHPILFDRYSKFHHTLWWLDLARGGAELLSGDSTALSVLHSIELDALAVNEVGFLLTEQATLLALALLDHSVSNLQRRQRVHNLALACGDSTLLLAGRFTGGLRARLGQLRSLVSNQRADLYADAIDFLARPDLWRMENETTWQTGMLHALVEWHMSLEGQRCGAPTRLASYVRHRDRLFTKQAQSASWPHKIETWLHALRGAPSFPYVQDPLERLARVAAGLAYGRDDPGVVMICTRLLDVAGDPARNQLEAMRARLVELYKEVQRLRDDPAPIEFYA